MNPISSLMECVFSVDIMEYFSNANAISCGDNGFFIILIFIFSKWILRAYKKWIAPLPNRIVGIARSRRNICDLSKRPPYNITCCFSSYITED